MLLKSKKFVKSASYNVNRVSIKSNVFVGKVENF